MVIAMGSSQTGLHCENLSKREVGICGYNSGGVVPSCHAWNMYEPFLYSVKMRAWLETRKFCYESTQL